MEEDVEANFTTADGFRKVFDMLAEQFPAKDQIDKKLELQDNNSAQHASEH